MFKVLLIVFLIAIGIFFSLFWGIAYHLAKFGVNRKASKAIVIFLVAGSSVIIGLTLWALLNVE